MSMLITNLRFGRRMPVLILATSLLTLAWLTARADAVDDLIREETRNATSSACRWRSCAMAPWSGRRPAASPIWNWVSRPLEYGVPNPVHHQDLYRGGDPPAGG
jgi:hypothetical protein